MKEKTVEKSSMQLEEKFEVRQSQDMIPAESKELSVSSDNGITFDQMVAKYKKRQRDTLVDTVSTGLSYTGEVAVDLGLMEDSGLLNEITDTIGTALPFAVIAVTEQAKVIMGKKTQRAAMENTVFRMVKTGAALGAGAVAGAVGGPAAAIPVAIGTRALLDQHKSKALLANRVHGRTRRLRELREKRASGTLPSDIRELTDPEEESRIETEPEKIV